MAIHWLGSETQQFGLINSVDTIRHFKDEKKTGASKLSPGLLGRLPGTGNWPIGSLSNNDGDGYENIT